MGLISAMQGWFNIRKVNKCDTLQSNNNKNHIIISIGIEKAFDKIQHLFMIKTLSKISIERTFLKAMKAIYDKTTANIILNGERLKAVLVYSHSADKDIPKIGQFTKERGLTDLQFHMPG